MRCVLYDAGALAAAERNDVRFVSLHRGWLRAGLTPFVPPAVLAQVWRSGRQAQLSRLMAGCRPHVMGFEEARAVGVLLAASGTTDVVDAAVVVAAERLCPVAVVTSDRGDLKRLARAAGVALPIIDV